MRDNDKQEKEEVKKRRVNLQNAIDKYVADHYLSGISTVFPSQKDDNEFIICITASKFNETNYWYESMMKK